MRCAWIVLGFTALAGLYATLDDGVFYSHGTDHIDFPTTLRCKHALVYTNATTACAFKTSNTLRVTPNRIIKAGTRLLSYTEKDWNTPSANVFTGDLVFCQELQTESNSISFPGFFVARCDHDERGFFVTLVVLLLCVPTIAMLVWCTCVVSQCLLSTMSCRTITMM